MKKALALVTVLALAGLAGCAVAPYAEPGVYVGVPPPVVVVRPQDRHYGDHYARGYGHRRHWD